MRAEPIIDPRVSMFDNIETMNEPTANITALLHAAASGSRDDVDALMGAIYDDLHRLAAKHLRGERPDHTLQPTVLVHEAYLKLIDQKSTSWRDRNHFFAIAARVIRRILVDHARAKNAFKRGAGRERVPLDELGKPPTAEPLDLLALDERASCRNWMNARRRSSSCGFSRLSLDEIAEVLEIGPRSVDRHWSAQGLAAVSVGAPDERQPRVSGRG